MVVRLAGAKDEAMYEYRIPEHVHLCIANGFCVWFDVRRDRFFGTDAARSVRVAPLVEGWPTAGVCEQAPPSSSVGDPKAIAQDFVSKGLLTRDKLRGKSATPAQIETPTGPLIPDGVTPSLRMRWQFVWRFLVAVVVMFVAWKLISIRFALSLLERRKRRAAAGASAYEIEYTRELVAAFRWLQLLIFTAKEACLFDSLALMWFLTGFDLAPALVIAVSIQPFSIEPFRAHCSIQQAGLVFNGDSESAREYIPICVI